MEKVYDVEGFPHFQIVKNEVSGRFLLLCLFFFKVQIEVLLLCSGCLICLSENSFSLWIDVRRKSKTETHHEKSTQELPKRSQQSYSDLMVRH